MLTEIALTPQVFASPTSAGLASLASRLRFHGQTCPLIFSNLNHGSLPDWMAQAQEVIGPMHAAASLVRDLFQLVEPHIVARPARQPVGAPDDDLHWALEAHLAEAGHPVDRVVVRDEQHPGIAQYVPESVRISGLEAALAGVQTSAWPPADDGPGQVRFLRPLWLHGQFLALVLPYGFSSEWPFFLELAARAWTRPAAFGQPVFELHISADRDQAAEIRASGVDSPLVSGFLGDCQEYLPRGFRGTLFVRARHWGQVAHINRRLFAGCLDDVDEDQPNETIRWGVAVEHVAGEFERAQQSSPTFTLMSRTASAGQFRQECRRPQGRLLPPIEIQGA